MAQICTIGLLVFIYFISSAGFRSLEEQDVREIVAPQGKRGEDNAMFSGDSEGFVDATRGEEVEVAGRGVWCVGFGLGLFEEVLNLGAEVDSDGVSAPLDVGLWTRGGAVEEVVECGVVEAGRRLISMC